MAEYEAGDLDTVPTESPLGKALGLGEDDVNAIGDIFASAMRTGGLDGARIFERLKAGDNIRKALNLPAGTVDLLYSRAHQWFQVGRADRAEPLFRSLCVLEPETADYWVGYGVCLRDRAIAGDARVAFMTAARLRPTWAIPHFHLFDLSARSGQWALAEEHRLQFEKLVDKTVPVAIREEVARLKAAVDLHRGGKRD